MQSNESRQKELAEKPINALLIKLSTPAIIGMIVNSLYNLVDAIFVGQGAGADALGGLAVAFPLQMIVLSIGIMVGVGSASILSRALGAGDIERARKAAGSAFFIISILGIVTSVLGLIFLEFLLKVLFGASEAILPYAVEYLSIIFLGNIFYCFTVAINHLIRAEGNARTSMFIMLISTGMNIVLDPIFIFGLDMGIRGAAIATVISLICSTLFIIRYYANGRSELHLRISDVGFYPKIFVETIAIGASTLMRSISSSVMAIVLYNSINHYGQDIHFAIVGAAYRITTFVFLPMIGLVQGLQPIAGFNYGAKNYGRVRKALRSAMFAATAYCSVVFLLVLFANEYLMSIFGSEQELSTLGGPILLTITLALPLMGLYFIGASYFQSIGKAGVALLLNSARQVLFLIPLLIIMPLFMGLDGVWQALPVADILSVLFAGIWLWLEVRELQRKHIERNIENIASITD